ncbi:MAG: biopolymer transporter ExbD [Verrucomicrobia bacterium]|nr:biopolymer transporter ExbD [Verrucomicrobiota bacterium]
MDADNKSYDDINVTPMVDLYLVLLLIFIIMTTAGVQGVKVNLPRGGPSTSKPIEGPKMQAVTVDDQSNIKLNAAAVTLDELASKLETLHSSIPDSPIVVRGSTGTPYQSIMDVLTAIGRAGFTNIGLATQAAKK